ncbi:MAG: NAD-binding protein [Ignavibacteria bacterium]|nr:NAD-binding protein [Ignavibacteria bacterium]
MNRKSIVHFRNAIIVLFFIIIIGTSGFILIEGWNSVDALYMTIITITTTGFEEVHQLSTEGEIFTLVLLLVSFGTVIYIGSSGIQILIESKFFRRKKMQKRIEQLTDHYIVCGFGRMGTHICSDLKQTKAPFVVIESNPNNQKILDDLEYLYDIGDASSDDTLLRAGVKKHKWVIV